jgi:hypothetical protein
MYGRSERLNETRRRWSDESRRLKEKKKDKKLWVLSVHYSAGSSRRLTIPLNQTVCIAYHASTLDFFRFGTVSEANIFKV